MIWFAPRQIEIQWNMSVVWFWSLVIIITVIMALIFIQKISFHLERQQKGQKCFFLCKYNLASLTKCVKKCESNYRIWIEIVFFLSRLANTHNSCLNNICALPKHKNKEKKNWEARKRNKRNGGGYYNTKFQSNVTLFWIEFGPNVCMNRFDDGYLVVYGGNLPLKS